MSKQIDQFASKEMQINSSANEPDSLNKGFISEAVGDQADFDKPLHVRLDESSRDQALLDPSTILTMADQMINN